MFAEDDRCMIIDQHPSSSEVARKLALRRPKPHHVQDIKRIPLKLRSETGCTEPSLNS
jgi:hypothetical protein